MKAVNPLVQLGIQLRRGVRQVMRVGSSLARLMLLEGISYHRERAFISHRASSPHLPLDRTEHKATGFLAESLCSKAQPGDRGVGVPSQVLPCCGCTWLGKKPAETQEKFSVGVTLPSPFSDSLLLNIFFPPPSQ